MSSDEEVEIPASGEAVEAALGPEEKRQWQLCRTCAGRPRKEGLLALRKEMRRAQSGGAQWVRQFPLNDAAMVNSLSTLRYLLEDVEVVTIDMKTKSYTALQTAIIWGHVETMVYLLHKGADPMLGEESSVAAMARRRQQRLNDGFDRAGDGPEFESISITRTQIRPLIEQGLVLLQVAEGVESHGSFALWAQHNGDHPLVRRFTGSGGPTEPRYQFSVLRSLVLARRASLLTMAEREARVARDAAEAAAKAREEQPFEVTLVEAGFAKDTAEHVQNHLRTYTLKEFRDAEFSEDQIDSNLESCVRNKKITEGELRRFKRYARELAEPGANLGAAAAPGAGAAKSKAKAAPKAKSALLAATAGYPKAKAGTKAAPVKAAPARKGRIDGLELLFREDLPDSAFMVVAGFLF